MSPLPDYMERLVRSSYVETQRGRFDDLMYDLTNINEAVNADVVQNEIRWACETHKKNKYFEKRKYELPDQPWSSRHAPVKALDSYVLNTPTGLESGRAYGIHVGRESVDIIRVDLDPMYSYVLGDVLDNGQFAALHALKAEDILIYRWSEDATLAPDPMSDPKKPADEIWDAIARVFKEFLKDDEPPYLVGLSLAFPLGLQNRNIIILNQGSANIGRHTESMLEGCAPSLKMQAALEKVGVVEAKLTTPVNDTVAACLYAGWNYKVRKLGRSPQIIMVLKYDGFNMCLKTSKLLKYGFSGSIVNLEPSHLTFNDASVDITYAGFETIRGAEPLRTEWKVTPKNLASLIRLAMIQVYQHQAPEAVWREGSLPYMVACQINSFAEFNDEARERCLLTMVECWDWVPMPIESLCEEYGDTMDPARTLYQLTRAIFTRSATIVATITAGAILSRYEMEETQRFPDTDTFIDPQSKLTINIEGNFLLDDTTYHQTYEAALGRILKLKGIPVKQISVCRVAPAALLGSALLAARNHPKTETNRFKIKRAETMVRNTSDWLKALTDDAVLDNEIPTQ